MERREKAAEGGTGWAPPFAATLVVLACTAFLAWQTGGETPRPADFVESVDTGHVPRPFLALLIAQAADCESAATRLGVLNAPELRRRMRLGTLLLGQQAEVARVAEVVRDHFGAAPVRLATRRNRQALRAIGVRATPHLVLLDRAGAVVFTSPTPQDAGASERLRLILSALTGAPPAEKRGSDAPAD